MLIYSHLTRSSSISAGVWLLCVPAHTRTHAFSHVSNRHCLIGHLLWSELFIMWMDCVFITAKRIKCILCWKCATLNCYCTCLVLPKEHGFMSAFSFLLIIIFKNFMFEQRITIAVAYNATVNVQVLSCINLLSCPAFSNAKFNIIFYFWCISILMEFMATIYIGKQCSTVALYI